MSVDRGSARAKRLAGLAAPWALCAALLIWGWRARDLLHRLPAYGDTLEVAWVTTWYGEAIRLGHFASVYPLVFHPEGWQVATFGEGPAMFAGLLPLSALGGVAFAYNVLSLLTFLVAVGGMYALARRFVSPLPAAVAAVLFAFWGLRWYSVIGQLNILAGTALLPWMVLCLERGYGSHRRWPWFACSGAIWALSMAYSLYFAWVGAVILAGWTIGRAMAREIGPRAAFGGLAIASLSGVLAGAPWVVAFWRASNAAGASFYSLGEVNDLGASLNSLPIPFVFHPFLGWLSRSIYLGPYTEQGSANLGLAACIVALVGAIPAWRDRRWRPVLVLTGLGLLLALGPALKWNDVTLQWSAMRLPDRLIWQLGHWLKPQLFAGDQPPQPFDAAIPMPGMLLSALVPFWERARVAARYSFIACLGIFLLAAYGLERFRRPWVRLLVAGMLILEVVPQPTANLPFPGPSHPAFEWLRQQPQNGEGIADLYASGRYALALPMRGEVLWSTRYTGWPTAAGASSVWPAHTVFLMRWLDSHLHALANSDFVPLMRFYRVRYILLHMKGAYEREMLAEANLNPELGKPRCFSPSGDPLGAWTYPICILGIVPPAMPQFNLLLRDGWSGPENWGVWSEGTESSASWAATVSEPQKLKLKGFPECVPGQNQSISIAVNGEELHAYRWQGCEEWSTEITVPARLVRVGWNDLILRSGYAARPSEVTGGQNPDSRRLAVGFSELRIEPMEPRALPPGGY